MKKPTAHPDRGVACSLRAFESQEHQRRRMVEAAVLASSRRLPPLHGPRAQELAAEALAYNVLVQS